MSREVPVGLYRTYAQPGDEEFTYDNWCRAVRPGRTFLSGGPLILVQVDGTEIGDTVRHLPGGDGDVEAARRASSRVDPREVPQGGVVGARREGEGARGGGSSTDVRIDRDSWLAARCGGPEHFDGLAPPRRVGTARVRPHLAVYVTTEDGWRLFDAEHARYMQAVIEGASRTSGSGRRSTPRTGVSHHHGEKDHLAYLEPPFLEALELVRGRLNGHGADGVDAAEDRRLLRELGRTRLATCWSGSRRRPRSGDRVDLGLRAPRRAGSDAGRPRTWIRRIRSWTR